MGDMRPTFAKGNKTSLNDLRIFVARSSTDSITCDTIRKRSKACSIPFFEPDVELFMRGYIALFASPRGMASEARRTEFSLGTGGRLCK